MPGPAISETEIRALVRQRIENGSLPVLLVHTVDGGYGSGQTCRVCGEPILASQVEYEVREDSASRGKFHMKCYAIWQLECAERIQSSGQPKD